MDHLYYVCLVFVMLSRLFIAALWSTAGKELTSWLSIVLFNCDFVTFPCGIMGQVLCLIVSFPDLYHLSYFRILFIRRKHYEPGLDWRQPGVCQPLQKTNVVTGKTNNVYWAAFNS